MSLDPYRFDLVFTGLCMFELDSQGANVLLVNASDPATFQSDPDFKGLERFLPHPHFPSFSYLMSQQIRQGVIPRKPTSVFAGPSGDEVGVCDVAGEELTLSVTGGQPFSAGILDDAPRLSSLLPVQLKAAPNSSVSTRLRLTEGSLETLRVAFAGKDPLLVDLQTIRTKGQLSGSPPRRIADQLVLRIDNLTEPVAIRSGSQSQILLQPDRDASGRSYRPVVATLANYHRVFHPPLDAAYDFLWFYELVEFTSGSRPSRLDLQIPVYLNTPGGFTGTSGVCPPIRI